MRCVVLFVCLFSCTACCSRTYDITLLLCEALHSDCSIIQGFAFYFLRFVMHVTSSFMLHAPLVASLRTSRHELLLASRCFACANSFSQASQHIVPPPETPETVFCFPFQKSFYLLKASASVLLTLSKQ
ncbi:hypothetical protein TRVL_08801 [Trypanosoma vivax]|nr:hypothetical protein TRVL_08801 [Trypanosoma vivax]